MLPPLKNTLHSIGIIGGGLAGLSLAILMARKGYQVSLFEKHKFPFHKVCGEFISSESLGFLKLLGIDPEREGWPCISRFRLTTFNGPAMLAKLPSGGVGASRYTLDKKLVDIAVREGVEVYEGQEVVQVDRYEGSTVLVTRENSYAFDLVIGCQGKRSLVDKNMGRSFMSKPLRPSNNFIGIKYHVKADLPKDLIGLHTFPNGYLGISAVEANKFCMCYLSNAMNLQKSGSIEALEKEVLSRNITIKNYLGRFERIFEKPVAISQISFQSKEKHHQGILMAGDSAGLVAPLSGNGMSMAFHSSWILAELVHEFFSGKISEAELKAKYKKAWHRAFQYRFYFSKVMQQVFFRPEILRVVVHTANLSPSIGKHFIKQAHGKPFCP